MQETSVEVAIIGGGPAGLMVADRLSAQGMSVHLYDRMPTLARKFLQAGKGGLNLTHSESFELFLSRFEGSMTHLEGYLNQFPAQSVRDWALSLGIETFVGSSGRVFPQDMKAAPLLRAWLHRLKAQGVIFHLKHRWQGWQDGALSFEVASFDVQNGQSQIEKKQVMAQTVVLALGGASWSHLGSDGTWIDLLSQRGVAVTPLLPANCGFQVAWEEWFIERYAGAPLKQVAIQFQNHKRIGEWVVTEQGVEGSLIYALSAPIRDHLLTHPTAQLFIDLLPYQSSSKTLSVLRTPKGKRSWSQHLKKTVSIDGVRYALLKHLAPASAWENQNLLAESIHKLPLTLIGIGSLDTAISTAGGVDWSALEPERLTLRLLPNYYCAGEMLDWSAPTGGYLLTMTMATAVVVANQILQSRIN